MAPLLSTVHFEQYEPLIGAETASRISRKAERLRGLRVENINSTFYGGGVAEMLSSFTLLLNALGVEAGWRTIQGRPDFFSVTKKIHNALQGGDINLSEAKKRIYEEVILENAVRTYIEADVVIVHDPQPLPLITHYRRNVPWVWRCHVDLSEPHAETWDYLRGFVEEYHAAIVTLPEYRQPISVPQVVIMPAIDPFSPKNIPLDEAIIADRFAHYQIPTDLPIVAQISRFDRWKDPAGVIDAFQIARKECPCTLVLLGNVATDDPEGQEVFESLLARQEERVIILSAQDTCLVNALQRKSAVILQKSIREGFGLTVTEAMWKGTPVIGGRAAGIMAQIRDGENGFIVATVDEAAQRMIQLLKDERLRRRLGEAGRETVRERFLMSRLAEQHLDLYAAFEPVYDLKIDRISPV